MPAPSRKKSILFVCMGNICRSPAGEGVFRHYVDTRNLSSQVEIDSAGTIGYHAGEPPDDRMCAAASRRGYNLCGAARKFVPADFERFDLIIAMDTKNRRDILNLDPGGQYTHKVRLLCDFHPSPGGCDVPDPYYGGPQGFEHVLDLIEGACPAILTQLMAEA